MGYTRWVNLALVITLAPRLLALLRFLRIYGFKALFQESIRYIKKVESAKGSHRCRPSLFLQERPFQRLENKFKTL
jgi:hypothetical protein